MPAKTLPLHRAYAPEVHVKPNWQQRYFLLAPAMNLLSVAFALLLTFLLVLARILLLLALFPHDPRFLPACPWSFLSSCSYFPTAHTNTRQHSSTDSVVASIASGPPPTHEALTLRERLAKGPNRIFMTKWRRNLSAMPSQRWASA